VQTGQARRRSSQGNTGASPRLLDVSRLNFRGLNHNIVFKSNLGNLQQRALSYEAPRFLDNEKLRLTSRPL